MEILIGGTGFVGSNLAAAHAFDRSFHSTDIAESYGLCPDLCVYAGARAEKYLAARDPEADLAGIQTAIYNIERIAPKRLVLISTIDVYPEPFGVDETSAIRPGAHPYGANRLYLETWVREHVAEHLVLRLPGLFGKNLKKNFLYDLIRLVPGALKGELYRDFSARSTLIQNSYSLQPNGFYKLAAPQSALPELKREFEAIGFSALRFTDSRSVFQFYHLSYLWQHLSQALERNIPLLNLAVEPLSAAEVYRAAKGGGTFENVLAAEPLRYDARTIYADRLGGKNGYLFDKVHVLGEIVRFVQAEEARLGL